MTRILSLTSLTAALGSCLVAGVLFAFSSFVMPALARLPPSQGIAAMQSINVTVLNRSFLGVFVGTAIACIALALSALPGWRGSGAGLRLAGALLYLAGTIAVTRVCNIPRNDALAVLRPDDPAAVAQWTQYVASWTAWNHVRTLAATLAAAALVWSTRLARP